MECTKKDMIFRLAIEPIMLLKLPIMLLGSAPNQACYAYARQLFSVNVRFELRILVDFCTRYHTSATSDIFVHSAPTNVQDVSK